MQFNYGLCTLVGVEDMKIGKCRNLYRKPLQKEESMSIVIGHEILLCDISYENKTSLAAKNHLYFILVTNPLKQVLLVRNSTFH